MAEKLSSYAFNSHGYDAKLYNGIFDLETRIDQLLEANNAEVAKRRRFEDDANQLHAELILCRHECIRLRNAQQVLAGYIEQLQVAVPMEIEKAMEPFPAEPASEERYIHAEFDLARGKS